MTAEYDMLRRIIVCPGSSDHDLAEMQGDVILSVESQAILDGMVEEKSEGTSLQTAPAHAVVYVARAGVQQELGNLPMALMDLEEAIRLDPLRYEAYLVRGQIRLSRGEKKEARADFEKAVELGLPAEEAADLLARCR